MENKAMTTLKKLRIEHGLKQKDMAKLIGISVSTYNYKENGISDFTLTEIKKIIELFNESFDNIFFDEKIRRDGMGSKLGNERETA